MYKTMAPKKSSSVVNSVPVVEVKPDDVNKIKSVDNLTVLDQPPVVKKVKKSKKEAKSVVEPPVVEIEKPKLLPPEPEVVPLPEPPQQLEIESNIEELDENVEECADENVNEVKKRMRRVVNKKSFYDDFESFVDQVNNFLESVKNEKGTKNAKNLIVKKLKQLQNDSYKLLRIKNLFSEKKSGGDVNSGFMKPIKISPDLATFFQSNPEEPMTRVQVTKKLCQYIKEKDLQNPEDRREIIPDDKLKSLFNLGSEKLTYYSMQKQIQQHIYKI